MAMRCDIGLDDLFFCKIVARWVKKKHTREMTWRCVAISGLMRCYIGLDALLYRVGCVAISGWMRCYIGLDALLYRVGCVAISGLMRCYIGFDALLYRV
jgi:hypothetical protein